MGVTIGPGNVVDGIQAYNQTAPARDIVEPSRAWSAALQERGEVLGEQFSVVNGGADKLDDCSSGHARYKFLDVALVCHCRPVKKPRERLWVHLRRRIDGSPDDRTPNTVLEALAMLPDGIVEKFPPISEDPLC